MLLLDRAQWIAQPRARTGNRPQICHITERKRFPAPSLTDLSSLEPSSSSCAPDGWVESAAGVNPTSTCQSRWKSHRAKEERPFAWMVNIAFPNSSERLVKSLPKRGWSEKMMGEKQARGFEASRKLTDGLHPRGSNPREEGCGAQEDEGDGGTRPIEYGERRHRPRSFQASNRMSFLLEL